MNMKDLIEHMEDEIKDAAKYAILAAYLPEGYQREVLRIAQMELGHLYYYAKLLKEYEKKSGKRLAELPVEGYIEMPININKEIMEAIREEKKAAQRFKKDYATLGNYRYKEDFLKASSEETEHAHILSRILSGLRARVSRRWF